MMQRDANDDLYVALRGGVPRATLTFDNIVELSLRRVLQLVRRRVSPSPIFNWRLTAVEQMRQCAR